MPKESIQRKYHMTDAALIQWLRKMHALLSLYLADFTAYDLVPTKNAGKLLGCIHHFHSFWKR